LPLIYALSAVAAVALAGSAMAEPSAAPAPAGLYVAPTGTDFGACTKLLPCASFSRAYAFAEPGETVEVAGGTYPAQSVAATPPRGGSPVVFRPAAGARVALDGELDVFASNVEFRDMSMPVWYVKPGADNVTLRRLDTGLMFITSATNVKVIGGDVGPWENTSSQIKACTDCTVVPTNILIDGVTFHDYSRTNAAAHDECLEVFPAHNITIRRSTFRNCAIIDLLIGGYNGQVSRAVLVENNFFDRPGSDESALSGGYYSLFVDARPGTTLENVLVRYNSSLATMYVETKDVAVANVALVGNVGPRQSFHCYPGVVFAHNVWDAARCGPTDRMAPSGFKRASRLNLDLKARSAAVDAGDPRNFPATDIHGRKRPKGKRPDAGADEAR
jgi:hypothetical protein